MVASFNDIPRLDGVHVRLEPLLNEHADELAEAVTEGNIYRLWYAQVPQPEQMRQEIARRLQQHADGAMVPWLIRSSVDGSALGMTTFLNIRQAHRHVEIGFTWLRPSVHGTVVNAEVKFLQLEYAFETLACIAVEFRAHFHNLRSRRALENIGAKQDGILRSHDLWRDGTLRDLVVFSVIETEWPTVRRGLEERIRQRAGS